MKTYVETFPYLIYGHCIELTSTKKSAIKCIYGKDLSYYDDICENLCSGETSGKIKVGEFYVKWKVVTFVVSTDWNNEYEDGNNINGVYNSLEKAQKKLKEIVDEDIENNKDHSYALQDIETNGEYSVYELSKSDTLYEIWRKNDYRDWSFCVQIKKQYIN